MNPGLLRRWLKAGSATAIVDFLFATCLSVFAYKSTFERLWQGVASVPFGAQAIGGGATWTAIGIATHIFVAFGWSLVFVLLVERWSWLQRQLLSPLGVLKVAAVYGPFIWVMMSMVFIPLTAQRPPAAVTVRWVIQTFGHIFFVATPMAWVVRRTLSQPART
jgi:uncharacterized membrane protein YagU involved in acid resistance